MADPRPVQEEVSGLTSGHDDHHEALAWVANRALLVDEEEPGLGAADVRATLGLGSAATQPAGAFDAAGTAAAATAALAATLGDAATLDVGTGAGDVAAGAHAAQHAANGADPVTPASIGAPTSSAVTAALAGKADVHSHPYQPADDDLTAFASLTPNNDDFVQRKSGLWVNRSIAQVKADLAVSKSDVGLGNVDNTSDANKPISTAVQAALDGKASTSHTHTIPYEVPFSRSGVVTIFSGGGVWIASRTWTIVGVRIWVVTAPTGTSVIGDITVNGTSIFTGVTANRPTITVGQVTAVSGAPAAGSVTLTAGQIVAPAIVQADSDAVAAELGFSLLLSAAV
ncbi:hypothetical protein [Parafrankia sp. EUN1f]|uniref:hypothetical protein n=1 Tax=Parafrankia sp. EUN1f TaxID=102897 RepID=UPI0001C46CE0|nr:hypothetical protein [Parafrankia sp. EUN1f]EFC80243.1 hypothetical protein FrEUN1fDRAFT_6637 [Parafrankia sp. EUN1f]